MNNRKEMRKKRKEKKLNLLYTFGNEERRGKEKEEMNFSFICLACNKKGHEKKICISLLLCPYKCERCIKIMNKYVTSRHIILLM